jgi:uncharacterized protein YecE (DUF72 family)
LPPQDIRVGCAGWSIPKEHAENYSDYSDEYLAELADRIVESSVAAPTWCIFDNTALGAATADALTVLERFRSSAGAP